MFKHFNGVLMHTEVLIDEDTGASYEHVADVTEEVNSLIESYGRKAAEARKVAEAAKADLLEIKNRHHWHELEVAVDDRTGLAYVVRTTYQWEAKTIRLDFNPETFPPRNAASIT